jgi:hypothetical protein
MIKAVERLEDIKLGYLYKGLNGRSVTYCICVGKSIVTYYGSMAFVFATLEEDVAFQNLLDSDDCETAIQQFEHNLYTQRKVEVSFKEWGELQTFVCIGKYMERDRIAAWLSQLKMCGCNVVVDSSVHCWGYIGDWRKRRKLQCCQNIDAGNWFIEESVAYLRQMSGNLLDCDRIWYYKGKGMWYWFLAKEKEFAENQYFNNVYAVKTTSSLAINSRNVKITKSQYQNLIKLDSCLLKLPPQI